MREHALCHEQLRWCELRWSFEVLVAMLTSIVLVAHLQVSKR